MKRNYHAWIDKNVKFDCKNKNVFITGSNSGIGFELAKHFAYLKANLYLLVRNLEKGQKAKEEIQKENKDIHITLIKLDLASFKSIKKCADELSKLKIDVFINNAGIFRQKTAKTEDGLEITMATNYIGTQLLNDLLLNNINNKNDDINIVFTTSITSRLYNIDYDDFYSVKNNNLIKRYARSKVAINDMYFNYVNEYKHIDSNKYSNIHFMLIHPGGTYTPLIYKGYKGKFFNFLAKGFMKLFFHSSSKAALCSLYALNQHENVIVGPRGLFGLSGYPKILHWKANKNYLKTINIGREIIAKVKNK